MSCQKRKTNEESGRSESNPAKRVCFSDDREVNQSASRSTHKCTDQEKKRILAILEAEFDKELQAKEDEVVEVQERIQKTLRVLQYLCYAVVSDFYSREKTITSVASTRQRRIHPAVKKLLSGKGPPGAPELPQHVTIPADGHGPASRSHCRLEADGRDTDVLARIESPTMVENLSSKDKKVPRYIPPKPKPKRIIESEPVRGGQNKVKTILVVGNVSKWLPPDMRDDSASHKWMVYVRGPKGNPDISSFVSKVRFFLHPSYRPNDVVQVVCPPFHLSRRGWGEFPIRVQVHFSNSLNKPVDIIHNLKLDRTHCGMQTLGSETVAEVWIHRELPQSNASSGPTEEPLLKQEESLGPLDDTSTALTDKPLTKHSSLTSLDCLLPSVPSTESQKIVDIKTGKICAPVITNQDEKSPKEKPVPIAPHSPLSLDMKSMQIKAEPLEIEPASSIVSTRFNSGTGQELITSSTSEPEVSLSSQLISPHSKSSSVSPSLQKTQLSPSKPAMQLVKCVDNNGTVRLLQVRADMLPKILKRGTTTIPPSPPISPASKAIVEVSSPHSQPQCSKPEVISHTSTVQGPVAAQVLSASARPASSMILMAPDIVVKPQNTSGQVSSQNAAMQTPSKLNETNVPTSNLSSSSANFQCPTLMSPKESPSKLAVTSPVKIQGVQFGMTVPQGVRPTLRLVRPAGNPNARPTLVAANPASQQVLRLPASIANNANRPLLVLKDGKLFMMKSALSSASAKMTTSVDSRNVNLPNHPSSDDVSSCDVGIPSSAASTKSAASTSSVFVAPTEVKSKTDLAQLSNVELGIKTLGQHTLSGPTLTQGTVIKPRASASVTSDVTMIPPKPFAGESAKLPSCIKRNLLPDQSMNPPQSVLLPALTAKSAVKAGKSLLKPAISLLKSNAAASIVASKSVSSPVAVSSSQSLLRLPPTHSAPATLIAGEAISVNKRIILGRTSGSSCITITSQQAIFYRELLRSRVQACPRGMQEDVWRAVRWMVKSLPLVHSDAKHPEFKILHPYCAPDEKTFCSWNVGKQRACEWLRAKTARVLMKEAGYDLNNIWTVREIVLWARLHGYTPGLQLMRSSESKTLICDADCGNPISLICKSGKISTVGEWLAEREISSPLSLLSQIRGVATEESDEEVDVVSSVSTRKVEIKQEYAAYKKDNCQDENLHLDPILQPLGNMVAETLNSVGLSLTSEEIIPGVRYPAAHRVLVQAVQSLIEDLARRAYAEAWGRDNISRRPDCVDTSNVCSAICHRPEYDIFTCAGLGINSVSDS